jgi:plastocyanin
LAVFVRWLRIVIAAVIVVNGVGPGSAAGPVMVEINYFAFAPQNIAVPKGATVRWVNRDSTPHGVAVDGQFESPVIAVDETFDWTFDRPGVFAYVCTVHPGMAGTVTVTTD